MESQKLMKSELDIPAKVPGNN